MAMRQPSQINIGAYPVKCLLSQTPSPHQPIQGRPFSAAGSNRAPTPTTTNSLKYLNIIAYSEHSSKSKNLPNRSFTRTSNGCWGKRIVAEPGASDSLEDLKATHCMAFSVRTSVGFRVPEKEDPVSRACAWRGPGLVRRSGFSWFLSSIATFKSARSFSSTCAGYKIRC